MASSLVFLCYTELYKVRHPPVQMIKHYMDDGLIISILMLHWTV